MPSILISLPEYLENRILSPAFTSSLRSDPSSWILPLPTATTIASIGFSLAVSGMNSPPAVLVCSSMRFTRMRS